MTVMAARYGGEEGPLGRPEYGVRCFKCGSATGLNTCVAGYVCAGECPLASHAERARTSSQSAAKPSRQPRQVWQT